MAGRQGGSSFPVAAASLLQPELVRGAAVTRGLTGFTQALGRAQIAPGAGDTRAPTPTGGSGTARAGAATLSPATLSPALPLPCPTRPGPGVCPGQARASIPTLGVPGDRAGQAWPPAPGVTFGAGQAQLFARHAARPAGAWGKASGKGVCVLLRGFGWGREGTRFPWPHRSQEGHRSSSHQDRQLAMGPRNGALGWFPCRAGLAPIGEGLGPHHVPAKATNQAGGNPAPSSACSLLDPARAPASSPSL